MFVVVNWLMKQISDIHHSYGFNRSIHNVLGLKVDIFDSNGCNCFKIAHTWNKGSIYFFGYAAEILLSEELH